MTRHDTRGLTGALNSTPPAIM